MRAGLADAWRGFTRGKPWARMRRELGVIGMVRALEVTHGANGWHPHLHVLVLLDRVIPVGEVFEVDGADRWVPRTLGRVIDRWREMVRRYIGAAFEPDDHHGVNLVPCHQADYVSKLGLEISDPGQKEGRSAKGRTPLQIASDYADASQGARRGRAELRAQKRRDGELWRIYCEGMRGARQLTWTRGLKAAFGIVDRADRDCAMEEEAPDSPSVVVGRIDSETWRTIRARQHNGRPLAYLILVATEKGGGPGLAKALDAVRGGNVGTVGA
jgi:hypothetical protein